MRQPAYNDGPTFSNLFRWPKISWTLVLVLVNVVVFIIECAMSSHPLSLKPDNDFFYNYLALSLDGIKHGYVWQLVTYQFMHGGFLHIFFNCWAIFMFGRIVEEMLGARNFLVITLGSGVVGGLFQVLSSQLWPQLFGDGATVGASAGAFGLVAAFATLFPERELYMLLFLVIPIRMRAKTLLIFSAMLAGGGIIFPGLFDNLLGAHVANSAHLGGILAGLLYVLIVIQGRWFHAPGIVRPAPPRPPAAPTTSTPPRFWRSKPGATKAELTADELLQTQVDPILDKISAHGLHSLSPHEREILEKASARMAKR